MTENFKPAPVNPSPPTGPEPIPVAIGVLVRRSPDGWRVLIARRPDHTVFAGYWEFPGGKADDGETIEACLVREFREELGVSIAVGRLISTVEHRYAHGFVRLHAFYCTLVHGEPRNLHVADHRWVRPDEFARFEFPPANDTLIERVLTHLRDEAFDPL